MALAPRDRPGVWLSPSEPLELRQTIVPISRTITRFGSLRLAAPVAFELSAVLPTGFSTRTLTDELPPAMYLDLSKEAALAARGFEQMPTGFALDRAFETGSVVEPDLNPEEIVLDSTNPPQVPKHIGPRHVDLALAAHSLELSSGHLVPASGQAPVLGPERFAIVDAALATVATNLSFMEAHVVTRDTPQLVVPLSEVA